MTNYEHMTDEEKRLAIINGLYRTKEGDVKPCPYWHCGNCDCDNCDDSVVGTEIKDWLDSEYEAPKTENEKFCETLKAGKVIVVWNDDYDDTTPRVRVFRSYDKATDKILCIGDGYLDSEILRVYYTHGRKLTAEERGEE